MNRDHLYLITSGFHHQGQGPFYCPGCAEMVGLFDIYPALKQHVEIHWVDFARPRPELVELIGSENQSCPVLVLAAPPVNLPSGLIIHSARGRAFIEGPRDIAIYLAHTRGTGRPFPP